MERKLKFTDKNWMVWRVLRQDSVETDAKPALEENYLALTGSNLLKGLFRGYKAEYQVLPDETGTKQVDYRYLGDKDSGSLGMNVPPWVEENRGKIVTEWYSNKRFGKVVRPKN